MTGRTEPLVALEVPTDPSGVRLCRLLVAGVADELDFDVDALEDLRIAVDELAYLVVDADDVPPGPLRVEVLIDADERLEVVGRVDVADDWPTPTVEPGSIQARLLDRTTSTYSCGRDGDRFEFRFGTRRPSSDGG